MAINIIYIIFPSNLFNSNKGTIWKPEIKETRANKTIKDWVHSHRLITHLVIIKHVTISVRAERTRKYSHYK